MRTALAGELQHGSIVIKRASGKPYRASIEVTELKNVAKETRPMEAEFLKGDNDIAPGFLDYVRPLVCGLPKPAQLADFPVG